MLVNMIDVIENRDLLQNILQSSTVGILVVSEDNRILIANPVCEALFNYSSEALTGKNVEIIIPKIFKEQTNVLGIKNDGSSISLDISLSKTEVDGASIIIAFLRNATKVKEENKNIQQTNDEIKESNRKYNALINNLQGIVYRCKNNRDWSMEYISKGCLHITGYSPEDFLTGRVHFSHIIFKEDQEQIWNVTQNGINKRKPFTLNFRIRDKKGSIKYLQELGRGIFNKNGKLEALEGFITDVTAQKETELQLRTSEAKMKALLEAMPDLIFIQNRKGDYLNWYTNNPEKLSLPPEKFIGLNMKEVLPTNIYQKIKSSHNKVMASGKMQLTEYSIQGKNGIEHYEARVVLLNNHSLLTIVRDVTEEKATDILLNIRNNALASASNSIIIVDAIKPNLPIIYCNKAFTKLTGYSASEVLGINCNFLQNDDRDQKEIDVMRNAILDGETCNVMLRNYKKDGTMFWNDVTFTPVYNEDNKLTHFIGVQNDVTHKVQEEDLKDKTQTILELITKDKPVKIIGKKIIEIVETHFKDCMASILVLDNQNKTLHKLVSPNLPKSFSNYIEGTAIGPKVGSSGTASFLKKEVIVSNIETSILWEDYKIIASKNGLKSCWAFPILSSTNEVLGTFSIYSSFPRKPLPTEKEILLDMTYLASIAIEKHNNTIALQESKKVLEKYTQKLEEKVQERTEEVMATVQKLVESNLNLEDQIVITKKAERDAIASKSIASEIAKNFPNGFVVVVHKDVSVLFAEGEALTQLGLKQLIINGTTIDDITIFSEERKDRIKENIIETLAGKHLSFETNYKNRYFAVNTAPMFDENNEINNALMVYTDISDQKEIEFNIQDAYKKERELNNLKSRFVSMASHEFRTPLSAILTSAILIGKQNEPGKEIKREKYVAQIEKNVKNLVVILNDFLSLSKLEEGKVVAIPERFDLISFSNKLVAENKIGLKKGQKINITSSNEEILVYLDTKLLRHILNNILSNASKYSPESSLIDFKISHQQEKVILQITDQGMGISKEEQQHLFDRFFRAKNAANIEGTGLGLNIAKNYTELMGGEISFKSDLNKGSTFLVAFPLENNISN